jgi:hypothetical protein
MNRLISFVSRSSGRLLCLVGSHLIVPVDPNKLVSHVFVVKGVKSAVHIKKGWGCCSREGCDARRFGFFHERVDAKEWWDDVGGVDGVMP